MVVSRFLGGRVKPLTREDSGPGQGWGCQPVSTVRHWEETAYRADLWF